MNETGIMPGQLHVPLLGNSVAVGIASLLHIALASLAVAFMMLAPLAEALGRTRPYYDDLAHSMARFTLVTYTASLVLAVTMVELFIGLFPLTNAWLFNRFRIPIGFALAAFLIQLLLLYPYYHFWERLRARSVNLHIGIGAAAFLFMLVWIGVLDAIGSFMLTPSMVDGQAKLLNPSFIPLATHRFMGDLVVAGYCLAGYGAWRIGGRDSAEGAYYGHMIRTGMLIGSIALLVQPVTGYVYAQSIERSAPEAYREVVSGHYQPLAYLQFVCVGLLFVGTAGWLRLTRPSADTEYWFRGIVIAAVAMVVTVGHPNLRRLWMLALVAGTMWMLYRNGTSRVAGIRPVQKLGPRWIAGELALVALATYLTMGTIRETTRHPDTVYGIISLNGEVEMPRGRTTQSARAERDK